MRALQLSIARTQMAEALDELSILVELRDARIAECGRVTFGDENVSVRRESDSGGTVEYIVAGAALAFFAECQQQLSVRREFEHLIADTVPRISVDRPDVSLAVRLDRVREGKHARAEGLDHLAFRRKLPDRIFFRADAALGFAAVHHPDIVFRVDIHIVRRRPAARHVLPCRDLGIGIGRIVDARRGLGFRARNEGGGRQQCQAYPCRACMHLYPPKARSLAKSTRPKLSRIWRAAGGFCANFRTGPADK